MKGKYGILGNASSDTGIAQRPEEQEKIKISTYSALNRYFSNTNKSG